MGLFDDAFSFVAQPVKAVQERPFDYQSYLNLGLQANPVTGPFLFLQGQDAKQQAAKQQGELEQSTKESLFSDIAGDKTLDEQTKKELLNFGGSALELQGLVSNAREGIGIYGVRRRYNEELKLLKERPTQRKTILTSGNNVTPASTLLTSLA